MKFEAAIDALANKIGRARLIDIGKRAGVISGLLGVLCVLSEFCFLFPDIFTSPELRASVYHDNMPIFRAILQAAILISFSLGTISILVLRSKAHGLAGIALALVATLMGGAKAEPIDLGSRAFHAGLDYFVLELLILGLLFIPMERLFTLREQNIFRKGWQTDLKHFFFGHVGVQLLSFATIIPVQTYLAWAVKFDFQQKVAAQPIWLQFFEILLCVDLISYWIHRAFHQIPWMWRFHAIHHSSLNMDWLAGSRTHLFDTLLNRTLAFVPIFLMGFAQPALYAYLVFVSFHAVYIHANVNHRWPGLRWIFATPEFHHWHHTSDEEGIDKNFAVFISFIDVLFRTAHMPNYWPKAYGTTKFQPPETYLGQLAYPFKKQSEDTPYG